MNFVRNKFRVKGDVVDINLAYMSDVAIRVEFFGDEIERISEMDPLTGARKNVVRHVAIFPASHYIVGPEKMRAGLQKISQEMDEQVKQFTQQGKLIEAQRIAQRTQYDMEMLQEVGMCKGIENYSAVLSGRKPGSTPTTLLDYFPEDFLLMVDESHVMLPQLHAMYGGDYGRKKTLVEFGFRLPSAFDNRPLKFEEVEEKIHQVIFVSATPGKYEQEQQSQSAGSGIIIKQDKKYLYIATNNHVVADADSLTVQFCDDETVSCEVKGTDEADDLAVVKVALSSIKKDTLNAIKIASVNDSDDLQVGQGVIAIGNALGYGQSVTNGIISALGRSVSVQDETNGQTVTNNNMIQTNAAINPGNSGGALLNAQGEVIGINSAKYSDTSVEGFGYAIPMSDAMPIINQLIEREKVDQSQQAFLGIQGQDISSDVAKAYNMPKGVYVYQVVSGSAADKAGIRQGDIITSFDGQAVSTMQQLKELMTYYKSGQKVKVTFQRLGNGYEEQTVEVTLLSQSGVTSNK